MQNQSCGNRNYKDQNGETPCDFLDVVVWGNTSEFVTSYFTKGSWIGIDGSIETRSYTDKDGNKRRQTEIKADRCFFVGSRENNVGNAEKRSTGDCNRLTDDVVIDETEDIPF